MSIFVRMLLKRKRRRKLRARAPSTGCHKIHADDVTASLPATVIWRTRQGCLKLGGPHPESQMAKRLSRRSFLHYGVAAAVSPLVPPRHRVERGPGGEDLEEATVAQLQDAMRSGARTSRSICAGYLARIAELDPKLHAVLETNPDALAIADRLDAERKANRVRGPMHGIPVLVKDNIATVDRMMTTAGSLALAGVTPPRDAPLVARPRAPRAVILGKTDLSERAHIRSTRA